MKQNGSKTPQEWLRKFPKRMTQDKTKTTNMYFWHFVSEVIDHHPCKYCCRGLNKVQIPLPIVAVALVVHTLKIVAVTVYVH
eukprot:5082854-Amphidinium_carterae.1